MAGISMAVDAQKITALKEKFAKYPPYAMKRGLEAVETYLNSPDMRDALYPPVSRDKFVWSSERQRRAYFATNGFGAGIPYNRTDTLKNSGTFKMNSEAFWVEYANTAPYAKWVIHPTTQIIGMQKRGWKPVNAFVVQRASKIVTEFRKSARAAWDELEQFMYGGGAGL